MMQIRVVPNALETNLEHMQQTLKRVQDADIALFPECCDLGWASASANKFAQPVPGGSTVQFMQGLAKQFHIYLVAGITEREGDKIFNTAVFISKTGELLGKYRKINLVQNVEPMYETGDRIRVYDTPMGKIGIDICADNLMPAIMIGESMAKMGARLILAPSSWAVSPERLNHAYGEEWTEPFTYLSRKYGIDILSVSNVGPIADGNWKGWSCIGNSIAIGNRGKKTASLAYGEDAEEIRLFTCEL
ncbi:MAG: carbon-nitrogen hydrolase family protein [Provencibacterium sp.]|nr:carbon-nitrogen hydrolase family protein [Provencibacterium sp.]